MQYCGEYAVRTFHIISLMEGVQYGPVTSSVGVECTVQDYQSCSGGIGGCIYLENITTLLLPKC